eukprot:387428_1
MFTIRTLWVALLCIICTCSVSMEIQSDIPLLSKLKQTQSRDEYIEYITNLKPETERYLIGGESIEMAQKYTSVPLDNNAERVLICLAAFMHYKSTTKWENPNVHGSARNGDILFRGYHTNGRLRSQIYASELLLLLDEMWLKHHPDQADIMHPLLIISDEVSFHLDVEYERHSTETLDPDDMRSLRFAEGGDQVAEQGYYETEVPIKVLNAIQVQIKNAGHITANDLVLRIIVAEGSYGFDVEIEGVTMVSNNTLEIVSADISGKIERNYNSVLNGVTAQMQLIDIKKRQAVSDKQSVTFRWIHYEITGVTSSTYLTMPQLTSQKVGIAVHCFGRELHKIQLDMQPVEQRNPSYRLDLIRIRGNEYMFETNQLIVSDNYELTILSHSGDAISQTKIGFIQNKIND